MILALTIKIILKLRTDLFFVRIAHVKLVRNSTTTSVLITNSLIENHR